MDYSTTNIIEIYLYKLFRKFKNIYSLETDPIIPHFGVSLNIHGVQIKIF
jgi:hypothetical protein